MKSLEYNLFSKFSKGNKNANTCSENLIFFNFMWKKSIANPHIIQKNQKKKKFASGTIKKSSKYTTFCKKSSKSHLSNKWSLHRWILDSKKIYEANTMFRKMTNLSQNCHAFWHILACINIYDTALISWEYSSLILLFYGKKKIWTRYQM